MKTYFIDKIGGRNVNVNVKAESLNELESIAIHHAECNGGSISKIYVHCSHVISGGKNWRDEQNVEYYVRVNNRKRMITTKRI